MFGKVIEGLPILDAMNLAETEPNDKPKKDIVIEETNVIINPYRNSIAELLMKEWKEKNKLILKQKE